MKLLLQRTKINHLLMMTGRSSCLDALCIHRALPYKEPAVSGAKLSPSRLESGVTLTIKDSIF